MILNAKARQVALPNRLQCVFLKIITLIWAVGSKNEMGELSIKYEAVETQKFHHLERCPYINSLLPLERSISCKCNVINIYCNDYILLGVLSSTFFRLKL